MHMADALLSPAVGSVMYAASTGATWYAVSKVKKEQTDKTLPLMAVSGAFVFAAQMINFTIPGTGSSGHIGGGMLLAGLLGGGPALLTMATVLLIQCLFFADGGLLAYGANLFHMGVIPCLLMYPLIFRPLLRRGRQRKNILLASVLATVVGLQLGAFGVVVETLASGVTELPFSKFVLLMQPIHLAIGSVEGILTAAILQVVYQMQPQLLEEHINTTDAAKPKQMRRVVVLFALLAVITGGILSLYASSKPDGLEWSVEKVTGAPELARQNPVYDVTGSIQEKTAILPDYDYAEGTEGLGNGTSVSGLLGAGITFVLAGALGFLMRKLGKKRTVEGK